MIKITLEPHTPEQLDAALALLQKIRDDKAKSDAEFDRVWRSNLAAEPDERPTLSIHIDREPGQDDEERSEEAKPVKRTRKAATPKDETPAPVAEQAPETPAPSPESPASPSEPAPSVTTTYTLEQVRARMAELSQAGKKDQLLEILRQHGASRLTDVSPADYAAVMAATEGL